MRVVLNPLLKQLAHIPQRRQTVKDNGKEMIVGVAGYGFVLVSLEDPKAFIPEPSDDTYDVVMMNSHACLCAIMTYNI
jgi:hypothetical protein